MAGQDAIRFYCQKCATPIRIAARFAGQKGQCRSCGHWNKVPRRSTREEGERKTDPLIVTATAAPPDPNATLVAKVHELEAHVAQLQGTIHQMGATPPTVVPVAPADLAETVFAPPPEPATEPSAEGSEDLEEIIDEVLPLMEQPPAAPAPLPMPIETASELEAPAPPLRITPPAPHPLPAAPARLPAAVTAASHNAPTGSTPPPVIDDEALERFRNAFKLRETRAG